MKAPWTPGHWSYSKHGQHWNNPNLEHIEINYGNDGECIADVCYKENDAKLIALAPEMAEAILAWDKSYSNVGKAQDMLQAVADKLQAIMEAKDE